MTMHSSFRGSESLGVSRRSTPNQLKASARKKANHPFKDRFRHREIYTSPKGWEVIQTREPPVSALSPLFQPVNLK